MIKNRLEQVLTQKLVITNKIVQSLNILNMSRVELEESVEREAESNPLLDVEIDKNEVDWEKYFENLRSIQVYDKNNTEYNDEEFDFENIIKNTDSLYDSLYAQINILDISDNEKKICKYLIDSLDRDGYLREDEEVIISKLGIDKKVLEKCICFIQDLEPCGIGARNIEECLIIQLRKNNFKDDLVEKIIKNDLNLIANSNIGKLCQKYKLDKEGMISIIEFIKNLEPKPVSMYSDEEIIYAYPDVYVEKIDGRSIAKSYNEDKMKLNINTYYKNLLINSDDIEAKKYIKEKLNHAKNIINDVENRNTTVVNLANSIIDEQRQFFDGSGDLCPLSMTELAEKLGCNVSTISRGVSDKYMLTEKGIYEFRYFFSNSHTIQSGDTISTKSIKEMIRSMIEDENKEKPLSDSKIETELRAKGIDIARRTVAKYREELGYLSSSKRKKIFK